MLKRPLVGVMVMSFATPASGAIYTVSQSGVGADYSVDEFNALAGDYSDDVFYFSGSFATRVVVTNIQGTSGHPVTLDGYQAGDCEPIGSECPSSANLLQGMAVGDAAAGPDHINVYDFRMTKTIGTGATLVVNGDVSEGDDEAHCDYITIERNYVYDSAHTMFHFYSGRYGTVANNRFKNYGQDRSTKTTQGINISAADDFIFRANEVGHDQHAYPGGCEFCDSRCNSGDSPCSAEMIELHGCHGLLMEYNNVYGAINQSGIRPKEDGGGHQTGIIIRYNKVHDNLGLGGAIGGESAGKGIYARTRTHQTLSEIYVYANLVYNNQLYGILFGTKTEGVHVWSNVVTDNGSYGIGTWDTLLGDLHIYNNTVARNGVSGDTRDGRGGVVISGAATGTYIKNNIFWNNRPAGAGAKFNQLFSSIDLSALEHNTYFHRLSTASLFYDGAVRTLQAIQEDPYNFEDDDPPGYIGDYGFTDPDGPNNVYGDDDDDYTLDGSSTADGADLSQCHTVPVQGEDVVVCYDDGIDPVHTDWTTTIPTVRTAKRDEAGWYRGAYVHADGIGPGGSAGAGGSAGTGSAGTGGLGVTGGSGGTSSAGAGGSAGVVTGGETGGPLTDDDGGCGCRIRSRFEPATMGSILRAVIGGARGFAPGRGARNEGWR